MRQRRDDGRHRPMTPRSPAKCRGWPTGARIGYYTGPREPNGCRLWLGTRGRYPTIHLNGYHVVVTRLILGLERGDPRVAMHLCDTPACVEPSHLRIGTTFDNMRDSVVKGRHSEARKTCCKHGHAFDAANTCIRRGKRACRACARLRWRKRRGSERIRSAPIASTSPRRIAPEVAGGAP